MLLTVVYQILICIVVWFGFRMVTTPVNTYVALSSDEGSTPLASIHNNSETAF